MEEEKFKAVLNLNENPIFNEENPDSNPKLEKEDRDDQSKNNGSNQENGQAQSKNMGKQEIKPQVQIVESNGAQTNKDMKEQAGEKNKKVDIKKLIQMKQTREAKQKMERIDKQNKGYFQKTHNSNMDRCIFCGETTFGIPQEQKQSFKLSHIRKQHTQFYTQTAKKVQGQKDDEQTYNSIAEQLFYFVSDRANKQLMSYMLGEHMKQQFVSRVERLPVRKDVEKWRKGVEASFSLL